MQIVEIDEDLQLIEKALRKFLRTTYVNDNIFRVRLGVRAEYFLKNILPILLENKILTEVEYQGSGIKKLKLSVPFEKLIMH
ncbi:MAG: hypothetical protein IPJ02_01620 [Chitinophagaceae bacterium]|nr:hypothetical protein [Chitinophagaceae bacterium]